ncbi:MAG: L,D-transpeptidase family protein [Elusimicrobiota bacterium]
MADLRIILIITLTILFNRLIIFSQLFAQDLTEPTSQALQQQVTPPATSKKMLIAGESIYAPALLRLFYQRRNFRPAWNDEGLFSPRTDMLIKALHQADEEGLFPEDYHLTKIETLLAEIRENISPNQFSKDAVNTYRWAELDLLLTDAFLTYSSHLLNGRNNPEIISEKEQEIKPPLDLTALLQSCMETNQIEQTLPALLPLESGYLELRNALAYYRRIAAGGGWPKISSGPVIKIGDEGEVEERISQIKLNMERWRWLPQDLERRYLLVNIADFNLAVMEDDKVLISIKAVVGRPFRDTPILSSRMDKIILNPYWYIPRKLALEDILPNIKKDPEYLTKQQIRVFLSGGLETPEVDPKTVEWSKITAKNLNYRFRQEPGPLNSLGRIKFIFPNEFDVYLHDTPAKELFSRIDRTFSSGCIRIEKAPLLAEYLLQGDPKWTKENILKVINQCQAKMIPLSETIAIYLVYWTAWADKDGSLHFRKDIYERDKQLTQAMREKPPVLP